MVASPSVPRLSHATIKDISQLYVLDNIIIIRIAARNKGIEGMCKNDGKKVPHVYTWDRSILWSHVPAIFVCDPSQQITHADNICIPEKCQRLPYTTKMSSKNLSYENVVKSLLTRERCHVIGLGTKRCCNTTVAWGFFDEIWWL